MDIHSYILLSHFCFYSLFPRFYLLYDCQYAMICILNYVKLSSAVGSEIPKEGWLRSKPEALLKYQNSETICWIV